MGTKRGSAVSKLLETGRHLQSCTEGLRFIYSYPVVPAACASILFLPAVSRHLHLPSVQRGSGRGGKRRGGGQHSQKTASSPAPPWPLGSPLARAAAAAIDLPTPSWPTSSPAPLAAAATPRNLCLHSHDMEQHGVRDSQIFQLNMEKLPTSEVSHWLLLLARRRTSAPSSTVPAIIITCMQAYLSRVKT